MKLSLTDSPYRIKGSDLTISHTSGAESGPNHSFATSKTAVEDSHRRVVTAQSLVSSFGLKELILSHRVEISRPIRTHILERGPMYVRILDVAARSVR